MAVYDGPADFLLPDGEKVDATIHAAERGGRWTGAVTLRNTERRLERGDVCQLTTGRLGDMRVIITDPRGTHRYDFVAMVEPDPWERLGPPV